MFHKGAFRVSIVHSFHMISQASLEWSGCSAKVSEITGVNLAGDMIHTTMLTGIIGRAKTSGYLASSGVPVGENKFIFSTIQKLSNIIKLSSIWDEDELFLRSGLAYRGVRRGGRSKV